eukprot:TRINITY_DN1454_c0_g1_i1.p1 TRINITY_DN1454_c0_g1~~TRINITY_DN1454_c0_g1_i1.p1  ORF type:complete len:166 (-),score=12.07 TRINITY_DN1454_c0_g1_i1:21-518(-)
MNTVNTLRHSLLGTKPPEPTLYDEITDQCPSLTWKQRLIGFGVCLGLGLLFCILAMISLPVVALDPAKFAVPYTIGNILAVSATGFLIGPMRQFKLCMKPTRIITSVVFVLAMALTLVAAFVLRLSILVVVAVVIQFCALTWYAMSYIPFARTLCKNCLSSITVG